MTYGEAIDIANDLVTEVKEGIDHEVELLLELCRYESGYADVLIGSVQRLTALSEKMEL